MSNCVSDSLFQGGVIKVPRRNKHYGNCPYCGEYDKHTKDHVIPQCLFPDGLPLPSNLPKVFACANCNNKKKSGHDTILRDFLVVDFNSSKSPIAQELFAPFIRSARGNHSSMAKAILERSRLIDLTTDAGIICGSAYTILEAKQWLTEIMEMTVRGLYYYYFHKSLSEDISIKVKRLRDQNMLNQVMPLLINQCRGSYQVVGDGDVFQCAFAIAPDVPNTSLWLLNFNRSVVFYAFTSVDNSKEKRAVS